MSAPGRDWLTELTDAELTALHRHVRLVYPYAPTEATVQEAFRRAARGPIGRPPTPRSWLRRVAREVALDSDSDVDGWRRRNAEMIQFDFRDSAESILSDTARQVALDLAMGLDELSPDALEVLRMVAIESLELDELAHVLGVTAEQAARTLQDARETLRRMDGLGRADEGVAW